MFDAQGNPVGTGDTVTFVNAGDFPPGNPPSCTVTETQTGGAASVVYACQGSAPSPPPAAAAGSGGRFGLRLGAPLPFQVCKSSGPQSDPITVTVFNENQEATVTVTNTFFTPPESPQPPPTPAPAAAVAGAPSFTG